MPEVILTSDMGSLFAQPDGPNGAVYWLGCHDLTGGTKPKGERSVTFCPDPSGRGKSKVAMKSQGQGGTGSFSIMFPLGKTADWMEILEKRGCEFPIYIVFSSCGERDVFMNADRGRVIQDARISSENFENWVSRLADGSPPVEATKEFACTYMEWADWYALAETRWTSVATTDLLGIAAVGRDRCLGACGSPQEVCEHLVYTDAAQVAVASVMYWSTDFGHTWTASAADPFAVDENAGRIASFYIDKTTTRVMTHVSETVAATPARIAYTDDSGATWTSVNVGSTNTEWINDIEAWNETAIWVCTDTGGGAAGNIYFSEDGGVTWALSLTGAGDSLNDLNFRTRYQGLCVGDTNEIQWTVDGGDHWTTITGPAAQAAADALCCGVVDEYRWFVGYDDGELWYTQDGGTTWTERVLPLPTGATAVANLTRIEVVDAHGIWMCGEATVGGNPFAALFRSVDGGYHWESWLAEATGASGMADMIACDYNRAFGVGATVGGTGLILEAASVVG